MICRNHHISSIILHLQSTRVNALPCGGRRGYINKGAASRKACCPRLLWQVLIDLLSGGLFAFFYQLFHFLTTLVAYLFVESMTVLLGGGLSAFLTALPSGFTDGHSAFFSHSSYLLPTASCAGAGLLYPPAHAGCRLRPPKRLFAGVNETFDLRTALLAALPSYLFIEIVTVGLGSAHSALFPGLADGHDVLFTLSHGSPPPLLHFYLKLSRTMCRLNQVPLSRAWHKAARKKSTGNFLIAVCAHKFPALKRMFTFYTF